MNIYSIFLTFFLQFWKESIDQNTHIPTKETVNFNNTLFNNLPYTELDILNLYDICLQIDRNFNGILNHLTYKLQQETQEHIWLNHASLKSPTSLRRKLIFDRNNSVEKIDDIVRGSVVFESEKTMLLFREKLRNYYNFNFEIDNFKNNKRFKAYFLKLSDPFAEKFKNNTVLIELQLHYCGTFLVQKYTHNLYKLLRNLYILADNSDSLGELHINGRNHKSIHPYFILIPFIKSCQVNKEHCIVKRSDIIIKENEYYFLKTIWYFNEIGYLKRYSFYFILLRFAYGKYSESIAWEKDSHRTFAKTLDKILSRLYTKAFFNKDKCDINTLTNSIFHN